MIKHKFTDAPKHLFREIVKLRQNLTHQNVHWLMRGFLVDFRQREAGFVLPTVALLLVVVGLVTTALIARTSNRTAQVQGERQGKVISNAASPAIDRAKAKLEYLFSGDSRLPNGVPGQGKLAELMGKGLTLPAGNNDRYTLKDQQSTRNETRLDLDGNGLDNAWSYRADTDANGVDDATVAYSIIAQVPTNPDDLFNQSDATVATRARSLLVRNGPVDSTQASASCLQRRLNLQNTSRPEEGWFVSSNNTARLRKNFQVNAIVISDNDANRTVTTLELQQDRQLDRGNKWGAWFRNDIELNRPPIFNWNGAMHTEGSIFVGENDSFTAYLLSAPSSCVYSRTASEITNSEITATANTNQFQGQVINGSIGSNRMLNNTVRFHLLDQNNQPVAGNDARNIINSARDSISASSTTLPGDIALDPVTIFTQDKSEATNKTINWTNLRDPNWQNRDFVSNKRIYNQREPKPYVDDTYRADNRYGPKPGYSRDSQNTDPTVTVPGRIGEPIPGTRTNLTNNDPLDNNPESLGLDGYWERQARREGLRVIVGQRLELSDRLPFDPSNPLRPLNPPASGTSHEARQRRALRDNLAAVQSSAIYHYKFPDANADADVITAHNSGYLPVACLATTAHPGTAATITNSTTFNNISINGTNRLNTDFLTGNGTNGWEFNPPANATTDAGFAGAIAAGQPLRTALANLAFFAGDYQDTNNDGVPDKSGAFPPTQETSGSIIHPHTTLTQWGNFSELRRVISLLDNGTSYANLSIADQSTLHTASCTLGMLAYNLDNLQTYSYTSPPNQATLNTLNTALGVGLPVGSPPEAYIAALPAANQPSARLINQKEQVLRDRGFGFASVPNGTYQYTVVHNTSFLYGGVTYNRTAPATSPQKTLNLGCNISDSITGNNYFGFGAPTNATQEERFIRLAVSLCSAQPKYPSLFYLFPVANHPHDNNAPLVTPPSNQPDTEPYIADAYIKGAGINGSRTYQALSTANITSIVLQPRLPANWQLPNLTVANLTTRPNTITERVTDSANNTFRAIPFLDKGMFNGREMMGVRVLDFDLDLLRRNTIPGNPDPDNWLPQSGVVYAFREDAVREDGIARPAGGSMNAGTVAGTDPQDPTITSANGITTKPVDFLPDPDRRPHGFRLKNGADLTREPLAKDHENNKRGLSLISDNPVYVQGDFNLHSTNGTNGTSSLLEEFTNKLNSDYSDFYTRSVAELDDRFASPLNDRWRPSEIIADAVTILSDDFADGNIEDGVRGINTTSYRNQNAPTDPSPSNDGNALDDWVRENPSDPTSPILISSNGNPIYCNTNVVPCPVGNQQQYSAGYSAFTAAKTLVTPTGTNRVNAIIVSGVVPSRASQWAGGLHNFPRFLESWTGTTFQLSGALIQLNFSTYATAPWDQQAWEPGSAPTTADVYPYYFPPTRLWGYDVALQMSPAGPVSRRFVTANNTRSEFYRELPADDPYIKNLRCARDGQGNRIDPSATSTICGP